VLVYLNGRILPRDQARIDPFDRGFLFGDGLYEGLRAFDGYIVGMDLHVQRLRYGLAEAKLEWDAGELPGICRKLLDATGLPDAFVYVHVTRGTPLPGHPVRARIPAAATPPTVFGFATATPGLSAYPPVPTKSAAVLDDRRWLRGRVKSISLMGSVLSAAEAHAHGEEDAVLVRETAQGRLAAESTSANLIIVNERGELVTPSLEGVPILAGVTRDLILRAAQQAKLAISVRDVPEAELRSAREVMLCGTLTMVTSITRLDGRRVGDGHAGPRAQELLRLLIAEIQREAGATHLATPLTVR